MQRVGLAPSTKPHANWGSKEPSFSNGHGDEAAAADVSSVLEILDKEMKMALSSRLPFSHFGNLYLQKTHFFKKIARRVLILRSMNNGSSQPVS